ncbi:MAG: aminopeptidase [Nanoarchaeota archaeon]
MTFIPEKNTLDYGAWNVFKNGLRLQSGESVLLITDESTRDLGDALYRQAELLTAKVPKRYSMEQFGPRPLLSLPSELEKALQKVDVTIYASGNQPGELAFRMPFVGAAVKAGARHGHAPGINNEIMLTGMQADILESNERCKELYERLSPIEWAHLTTPAGTDIRLEFSPNINWINSDWDFSKKGEWHNIPSGEVFTWPSNTNGIYVVDGVLGDHFDQKYGSLEKTPVKYTVRGNHITDIKCPENSDLETEINKYVFDSHNGDILGEIGVGALDVKNLIGRMLQDEKASGTVHIAHGNIYSERTGAPDYRQTTHCDGVMRKVTLETNKEFILREGIYQPSTKVTS